MSFFTFLTNFQLEGIGRVAVESAWLEANVERYISRLSRLSRKNTDALLVGRMMAFKLDTLKMLGRAAIKDPTKRNEFSDLMAQINVAVIDRNTVIHGLWRPPRSKRFPRNKLAELLHLTDAVATKKTSPGNHKTMPAAGIEKTARALTGATWSLIRFADENWLPYLTRAEQRQQLLAQEIRNPAKKSPTPQGTRPRP